MYKYVQICTHVFTQYLCLYRIKPLVCALPILGLGNYFCLYFGLKFQTDMIHILGAGSIGSLFAVALSQKNAVNLLLKPSTYTRFTTTGQSTIRISAPHPGQMLYESQFGATPTNKINQHISQLVVAVKSYDIATALFNIRNHITPETEVLIIHNGMGVKEELQKLWPEEKSGPNIAYGVTNAGSKRIPPLWDFEYSLNGVNTICGNNALVQRVMDTKSLFLTDIVPKDRFQHEQKKKLVVNSVINPLTAILQCPNGALPSLNQADLLYRLTYESSTVLGLNTDEMYNIVLDVIQRTSTNLSSMLVDVEAQRQTEVDYINGYIVNEAKRQKLKAPINSVMQNLVNMRRIQVKNELEHVLPQNN